ncbi:hypothetical protein [Paenibacillus sp. R14(2021)]|uniref:hypothetical protein n=1 Tax=Paenibacillus sp. R14(2021) TaxID=2859228 RepID=UPI001C613C50|nr:hypothetical protein [Paenibacillus sp. R14(2021)]
MRRRTDEMLNADGLSARLRGRPFHEERVPSQQRIAIIQASIIEERQPIKRTSRPWIGWSAAVLACLALLAAFVYAYDRPGGIADWRYSRAAGYPSTMSIPIGRTPEEAVQKFRQSGHMQVVHKETIDGGVLLFIKRGYQKNGTDLQIEFVRKSWLGWKWVMGGGYGLSDMSNTDPALNYMSMPKFEGVNGPFPIVFGQFSNPSVTRVIITVGGPNAGAYTAKTAAFGDRQTLWFVVLPLSASSPYSIEAYNGNGEIVAFKTFDDPDDFGSVLMRKSR